MRPGQIEKQFERSPAARANHGIIIPPSSNQPVPPKTESVTFVLGHAAVSGSTVYSEADFAPYFGKYLQQEVGLSQLDQLAGELTALYRNDGYILSRVIVPPQAVHDGHVDFQATEGFIDQVKIGGVAEDPNGLAAAYGEKIKHSRPLRSKVLERYLLLMNDLGGVYARSALSRSRGPVGASDLNVVLAAQKFSGSLGVNNRGSRFLGPWRADAEANLYSLLTSYDQTNLRLTSTIADDELRFVSLSHERPIGREGARVGFSATAVDARPDLGAAFANTNLATNSRAAALTLAYPLIRTRTRNLQLNGAFTYHNGKTDQAGFMFSKDHLRAVRVGANFDWADTGQGVNVVNVEVSQGLNVLDATRSGSANLSRAKGRSDFLKATFYAARLQSLAPRWSVLTAVSGQAAFDSLLSPEQFGFGGEQFGRAYDSAEIIGDSGVALKTELRYTGQLNSGWLRGYTLYGFHDVGLVRDREPAAGQKKSSSGACAGLGARFALRRSITGYVEAAQPLTRDVNGEGNRQLRFFAGVTASFQ